MATCWQLPMRADGVCRSVPGGEGRRRGGEAGGHRSGDLHDVNRETRECLIRIETGLAYMKWTLGLTAAGSLALVYRSRTWLPFLQPAELVGLFEEAGQFGRPNSCRSRSGKSRL